MSIEDSNQYRQLMNEKMAECEDFFKKFGEMDDDVYEDKVIPKKYKELMGLAISIVSNCEECITYHLQGCKNVGASKKEIIEAIKMGIIGGGSVKLPMARHAFRIMEELRIV